MILNNLGIEFSRIFKKKHGKEIFQEIVDQINSECNSNYNKNYIDIVFSVAFITYFGIKDNKRIALMLGILQDNNIDIAIIRDIHKQSISKIQKYIQATNNENLKKYKK